MRSQLVAASAVFLAFVSSGAAQGASGETASCDAERTCEGDTVRLLQHNIIKESRLGSLSEEQAEQALHAALDALEGSRELEDWGNPFEGFGSSQCKHVNKKGCPQIECSDLMVNTTCPNSALGTGRETCGACRADHLSYELVSVKTSDIPSEMSIPGPGSSIPVELQGVLWMDQFGHSVNTELLSCDPNYRYDFPLAATELALTFGDTAVWNPETQCVDRIYYGGEMGSWSWLDSTGKGGNPFWTSAYKTGVVMSFCRTDATTPTYNITIKIKFRGDSLFTSIFNLLGFKRTGDGYWLVSDALLGTFSMVKTCFGWDRVTRHWASRWAADAHRRLRDFITKYLPFLEPLVGSSPTDESTQHYPVFQVVDGMRQKTPKWDEFYKWATVTSVEKGLNKGGDMLLLGRPKL